MSDKQIRIGFDVAQLSDKAFTGIPLYVESVLRELLEVGEEEYVLVGSDARTDLPALMEQRQLPAVTPGNIVPQVDTRIGAAYPHLMETPANWLLRKIDGRLLLPLNQTLTARRLGPLDIMHHTSLLRVTTGPIRHHVVTIYDLTTRFFAETHKAVNIAEWERVFTFARDHASLVITISESAKLDIIEQLGIPEDRVRAILLGVRPLPGDQSQEQKTALLTRLGIAGQRFVLAAGSLEPRKNLPRLIEAFAELTKAPEFADVRLVLTGARLHGATAVDEAMARHQITDRVVMTGYASDEELAMLMQTCDVFIYPSVYEGFGLPVAEAMALGAPVVTSRCSSIPEVAGDAAILFDPKSVEEITDAMRAVLSDAALADDLRRRGKVQAAQFSWKRCAEGHRQAYHDVAGR